MLTRLIPRTQESLPVIGCGTYRGFDTSDRRKVERLGQVIDTLFAAGGRVVDSSPMYGKAEETSGALIASRPSARHAFIATKVWTHGRADGVRQMERSLRFFQTDCIDLMQVHNLVDLDAHMRTLIDWKAQGRVRYIGITHYSDSAHRAVEQAMRAHPIDFVQINYALDNRAAEQRVLPAARDLGIGVIVNYPLGGGGLVHRLANRPLPDFATQLGFTSWPQLLLHFIVAHEAVTCAIPGTANPAHMADNIAAAAEPFADRRADILTWWSKVAL